MLILASASPRRQELLRNAGFSFLVEPTNIPEIPQAEEPARVFVERLAWEKARAVAERHRNDFVLGADTTVVVDSQILNKPDDAADAARMLRLLSGRTHQVTTGVCLISPVQASGGQASAEIVVSETTSVTFQSLTAGDIDFYVETGEPMDKAGAYGIQGIASRWITRIDGDYFNVVGLPVALVSRMLSEYGFRAEE
jgi:septum formation protein